MSRTKTTDALPIPLISCPCPSAFSPRGFFLRLQSSLSAPTRRAALSRQTVFPLGQFDEVKDAVRIPSGGVFLCLRLWGVPAHRSRLPTPARASPRFCGAVKRAGCRGRRLSASLRVCVSRGRVFPRFGGQGAKMGRLRRSGVLAPVWGLRPPVLRGFCAHARLFPRFCGAAICPECPRRPLIAALCV